MLINSGKGISVTEIQTHLPMIIWICSNQIQQFFSILPESSYI